jgi:hypothetical protein
MTRLFLAAGVAALAISAPAASQPGDRGKDRGTQVKKDRGDARAARTQRAERRAERPRVERRAERQRVEQRAERRAERPRVEQRAQRVERRAEAPRVERRTQIDRTQRLDQRRDRQIQRIDRQEQRIADQRLKIDDRRLDRAAQRNARELDRIDRREVRLDAIADRRDRRLAQIAQSRMVPAREWADLARRGVWLDGCPPGLAKKPVACVPPGQVKNVVGKPLSVLNDRIVLQDVPNRLRYVYADTPDYYYRYGNGYVYQVNRNDDLIMSLLPLFGLGLTVGQPFPMSYNNYYMPTSLQPFYANSPYDCPRYANGYVYEVDCVTGLIEDVDPLMGYGYGYGQMMPATYSAYNVPYQYRSLYYDTSDAYYRYAPGAIYQVDPTTSLITAVAALLTGGMTVGQPLPAGYGAYNVPYAYRTSYYDTPNDWYRYSNGYIYRVDPATQLVTAIVASALT